jgi:hypothetical protein
MVITSSFAVDGEGSQEGARSSDLGAYGTMERIERVMYGNGLTAASRERYPDRAHCAPLLTYLSALR